MKALELKEHQHRAIVEWIRGSMRELLLAHDPEGRKRYLQEASRQMVRIGVGDIEWWRAGHVLVHACQAVGAPVVVGPSGRPIMIREERQGLLLPALGAAQSLVISEHAGRRQWSTAETAYLLETRTLDRENVEETRQRVKRSVRALDADRPGWRAPVNEMLWAGEVPAGYLKDMAGLAVLDVLAGEVERLGERLARKLLMEVVEGAGERLPTLVTHLGRVLDPQTKIGSEAGVETIGDYLAAQRNNEAAQRIRRMIYAAGMRRNPRNRRSPLMLGI